MATTRYCLGFCGLFTLAACAGKPMSASDFDAASLSASNPKSGVLVKSGPNPGSSSSDSAPCRTPGETQTCCTGGTRTCGGPVEFMVWGPCLDNKGAPLTCNSCATDEFGPGCDAGIRDGGSKCGETEFGPSCDAGMPTLCSDPTINNEPEILAAYAPASGGVVNANGQIKVWINDERAAIIAPNEVVDPMTGIIQTPGDRTAKAGDGYLWEPALYIAPQTAENGGRPHFPQAIKGWYNNNPATGKGKPGSSGVEVPGMDPVPPGTALTEKFTTEDIWDVSALGLSPGTYTAEFVIHDGDKDRAVGCITIVIGPP
jgi:hypothetical protein